MARSKKTVDKKYYAPFPTRLRKLMEERGETQEDIASIVKKSRQTVSQYCNGVSEPGYDTLVQIANHYGVATDFLLGLSDDPSRMPSAIDDLGLSLKAVDTIERLDMFDTPNGQIQFRNAASHALDVLNCLLESPDFYKVIGNLLMCFDSFWINANGRDFEGDDYDLEEEMRDAGHIILKGDNAARFYANEAGNSLRELVCKEIPILVDSCIKGK